MSAKEPTPPPRQDPCCCGRGQCPVHNPPTRLPPCPPPKSGYPTSPAPPKGDTLAQEHARLEASTFKQGVLGVLQKMGIGVERIHTAADAIQNLHLLTDELLALRAQAVQRMGWAREHIANGLSGTRSSPRGAFPMSAEELYSMPAGGLANMPFPYAVANGQHAIDFGFPAQSWSNYDQPWNRYQTLSRRHELETKHRMGLPLTAEETSELIQLREAWGNYPPRPNAGECVDGSTKHPQGPFGKG